MEYKKMAAVTGIVILLSSPIHASGFPDYIKGGNVEAKELDIQYQHISTTDETRAKKIIRLNKN